MTGRRRHLVALAAVGLALVATANGCSSAAPDAHHPFQLRGTYEATSTGPIDQITVSPDLRYELTAQGCNDESCIEKGTYAFDDAQKTLILTSSSEQKRALPLEVLAAASPSPAVTPGGPQPLTDSTLVAQPPAPLVDGATASLLAPGTAQKALIAGQSVQLTNKSSSCLVTSIQTVLPQQSQQLLNPQCGFYEPKPCDPSQVVSFDFNTFTNIVDGTGDCLGCGGAALGAAFIAGGGTVGSGGILTVPAGVVAAALLVSSCAGCYNALRDSGTFQSWHAIPDAIGAAAGKVPQTLSCALVPCQYTTSARQTECQTTCKTAYAYVARVGSACQCTDNASEACCRVKCYDSNTQPDDSCSKCVPISK